MSFLSELREVHESSQAPTPTQLATDSPEVPAAHGPPVVDPTRTRHPYAKAFACAGVTYLAATALALAVLLYRLVPQATAPQLGDATAGVLILFALPSIVPALLTGLIVSHAARVWPLWQIALLIVPMFCAGVALQTFGMFGG